ncbi:MAG: T9SS type A sorting domain-containing protein [Bacteroidota bacterium]|nr:T9SS type A sorting domain-containing protein [Bacteroidota bacterium]
MKKKIFFLLFLGLSHFSFSQQNTSIVSSDPVAFQPNSINKGILSFFVTDAENGYGTPAEILFSNGKTAVTLQTNEGGHLVFNGSEGKYNVTISAIGYNSLSTYFVIEQGKTLNIEAIMEKQFKPSVDYMIYTSPIVEGYVIDFETGKPLAEIEVELTNEGLHTKTNKDGFFSVSPSHFSVIEQSEDKAIRSDFSFSMPGYTSHIVEDLLMIPDKIKLKIALKKGSGSYTDKYIQHVLDGTQQDVEQYEKAALQENTFNPKSDNNPPPEVAACIVPTTIRVGVNCSCTNCNNVSVMSLQHYTESGLDNEWIPSWQFNSLAAGSFPYRTYGGYYVNHPVKPNFDIASSTCNQVWGSAIYSNSQSAAQLTSNQILTANNVNPARSEYSAQNNFGGTSYNCANCKAGGSGSYNCYSDNACCGKAPAGHGRGMCQWGTQNWALNGQNYSWMLNHYFFATIGYSLCGGSPSPPPNPTITSSNTCGNKTLTRANPPSGVTYYWQGTSCGTSTANSALNYTVNTSGTYYLRSKNSNGWSTTCSSKTVTINDIPNTPPPPVTTTNPCGSQTLTRGTPPGGVKFYWQGTSCGTSTTSFAPTYTAPSTGTYRLRARQNAGGCWSNSCSSVAVAVAPTPATPPLPSMSSNSCGPITLTMPNAPAGQTYYWEGTSCGISTTDTASTFIANTSGVYRLRALSSQACWSNCRSVAVTITDCPENLLVSYGPCSDAMVNFSWINSNANWTVEVSLDSAFNNFYSKPASNVTLLTGPAGFTPALDFQSNATYYWRILTGNVYTYGPSFTLPFCDVIAPATIITPVTGWQSTNFIANFTDSDDSLGSGLGKSFYRVIDFDGTEWRANGSRGFANDNFDDTIVNSDWTSHTGIWASASGYLEQSDQTLNNTNIAAPLTQNLSNRYLYHWNAKIDGTGSNRKAGFHFFSDSVSLPNRGNSYLVWFSMDESKLEFYKVTNDLKTLVKSKNYSFIPGQFYDFKLIYDRIIGKMDIYINNIITESWADATPITSGNAVSFRTDTATMTINYFKAFRSRLPSVTVNVGTGNTNDIRFENSGPPLAAGKVESIITDSAGNLSPLVSIPVDVDWTAPSTIAFINDGSGADISTTYNTNELKANWSPSSDPNSGIVKYHYSIGTTPGDTDLVASTDNFMQMIAINNPLPLVVNQLYYFNVRSENGAGLFSSVASSNGQMLVLNTTSVEEEITVVGLNLYPNPFNNTASLDYTLTRSEKVEVGMYDLLGKEIVSLKNENQTAGDHKITIDGNQLNLSKGLYLVVLKTENTSAFIKIVFD